MEEKERKTEYRALWQKTIKEEVDKPGFSKIASLIGSGEFAKVYKIKDKKDQKFGLVVKIQNNTAVARSEIKLLKNTHGQPNLGYILDSFTLKRKGWIWDSEVVITVMPFMDGGLLANKIYTQPESYTKWVFYLVYQFQKAYNLSHCDTHLQNFMLQRVKQDKTVVEMDGKTIILPETPFTVFLFDPVSGEPRCEHGNRYYDYFNCVDSYYEGRLLSAETKLPPKLRKKLEKVEELTYKRMDPHADGKKIPRDKFISYSMFNFKHNVKKNKASPEKVFLECFAILK
jgi:hypothetical protein